MTATEVVPRMMSLASDYSREETIDALLIVALVGGLADDLPSVLRQRLEVLASDSTQRPEVSPALIETIVELLASSVSAAKEATTQAARRMLGSQAALPSQGGVGMKALAIRAGWSPAGDGPGSG